MKNFLAFIKRIAKLESKPIKYKREEPPKPKYNVPSIVPDKHKQLFIDQALKAGVTPEQFGTILKREQGASTTFENAAMVGGADPTDRGLMQVNKVNEPLIQKRFMEEYGVPYDPNNTEHSIIGGSMTLQENRRIFEQMRYNQTYTGNITNNDIVNSYNLGPRGIIEQKQGDQERTTRLNRYIGAGQE